MQLDEAKQILENEGYNLVDDSISLEKEIKKTFLKNGWKCNETFERSGGVHIIFSLISSSFVEIDLFIKGSRYSCSYFMHDKQITEVGGEFDSAEDLYSKVVFEKY